MTGDAEIVVRFSAFTPTAMAAMAAMTMQRGPTPRRLLILALTLGLGAGAAAQDQENPASPETGLAMGRGRASGQVLDADGKPLPGASVTLRLGEPPAGPPSVTTDSGGRWAFLGLGAGRWKLTVEAPGWITAEGWVEVREDGPASPTRLRLRPLSEATPGGAEVPQTIYSWLEKGNALLSQGKPAEARAEYEKAARTLPPSERPEVLRAIARTWYLEGDRERAVATVEEGLKIDPADDQLRQLLKLLLEELGRPADAEAFLKALAAGTLPPAAEPRREEELPPAIVARLAAPADAPLAGRSGTYKVAFTERSPLSDLSEVVRRGHLDREKTVAEAPKGLVYRIADESFEVLVPDGEPRAAGWALLVWVSPWDYGGPSGITGPALTALLAERRMIWVGAHRAGNERPRVDRWGLAVDAAEQMRRLYKIDPARIYAGGHSGGGRAASALALLYPDLFRGALMMMGIDWYRDLPVADKPGARWPAPFGKPPHDLLRLARERSRLVLFTGERDFNRAQTRAVDRELRKDGFKHVTYLEQPGMTHWGPVPKEWMEKAFSALDP